jgi:transcriptional regulator with XRE-family HTH domain
MRLKAVRESLNLTPTEMADRMGLDPPALSRLESGKYLNVTLVALHRRAEVLGPKLDGDLSCPRTDNAILGG